MKVVIWKRRPRRKKLWSKIPPEVLEIWKFWNWGLLDHVLSYIFREKFWSTSVDQSVDLQISTKIRGKKRLFSWHRKMAGGFSQFEWLVCRRHFKTCPRDVFSPGPTPTFILWTVMKKSIFEIFEKWPFWGIFWPFLLYFGLKYVKNVFLLKFCVEIGRMIYFMVTGYETDVMITIY